MSTARGNADDTPALRVEDTPALRVEDIPALRVEDIPALRVEGLSAGYGSGHGRTRVVHDASLVVRPGEIVGVIGETGSGKTTLARAVAGLVGIDSGQVWVGGEQIAGLSGRALRRFRRTGALHYVFQDPLRSLDPDLTVGQSIAEGLNIGATSSAPTSPAIMEKRTGFRSRSGRSAMIAEKVAEALKAVGLPEAVVDRYPGQISGGQRQRVSIARAIAGNPRLLILDEPVSALDASNRNHILRLIDALRRTPGSGGEPPPGMLLISHDLSSLAGIADRVVVLYRGRIIEEGPIQRVFEQPQHPYTALLIASAPSVRREHRILPSQLRRPVSAQTETRPDDAAHASGCAFAPRCRFATDACSQVPAMLELDGRGVACHAAETWRDQLEPVAQTA